MEDHLGNGWGGLLLITQTRPPLLGNFSQDALLQADPAPSSASSLLPFPWFFDSSVYVGTSGSLKNNRKVESKKEHSMLGLQIRNILEGHTVMLQHGQCYPVIKQER